MKQRSMLITPVCVVLQSACQRSSVGERWQKYQITQPGFPIPAQVERMLFPN